MSASGQQQNPRPPIRPVSHPNVLKSRHLHQTQSDRSAARLNSARPMSNIDPLPTLWLRLRSMFVRASESIGAPHMLARLGALSRQRQHEIGCWIARLECIARKLLFAEAGHLQTSSFRTRAGAIRNPGANAALLRSATPRDGTLCQRRTEIDLTQPHTWPARFKLAPPRDTLAVPESRAPRIRALWGSHAPPPTPPPRAAAQTTPMPTQFAFRVEALRRVLENPAPHVRRLARVLHRLTRRFPEAPLRYAVVTARPYAPDAGDPRLIVECLALAIAAAQSFLNSS